METYLCQICGTKIDSSQRICPSCGAINPHNEKIIAEVTKQVIEQKRAEKTFSNSFLFAAIIIGLALFIASIILLAVGVPPFCMFEMCGCAVSSGVMIAFGIIGLTKKEDALKGICITGAISIGLLITTMPFLFF